MVKMTSVNVTRRIIAVMLTAMLSLLLCCSLAETKVNAEGQGLYGSCEPVSVTGIENARKGVILTWDKKAGSKGYRIFRKDEGSNEWVLVKSTDISNVTTWKDKKNMVNGRLCQYLILSVSDSSQPPAVLNEQDVNEEDASSAYFIKPVRMTHYTSGSDNRITAGWTLSEAADGYELQISSSPFFADKESIDISGRYVSSYSGQTLDRCRYARVRAYKTRGEVKDHSCWSYSPQFSKKLKMKIRYKKVNGKKYDFMKASRQKLNKYDTFQGACSRGEFSYHFIYSNAKDKAKLIKVNMNTGNVVRVGSKKVKGHSNSLTYNEDDNIAVSTYGNKKEKNLTIIDLDTMRPVRIRKIVVPDEVAGANRKIIKKIKKGVTAISYNSCRKKYVARIAGTDNFVILNRDFVAERYVKAGKRTKQMRQSIFCTDDMIVNLQSRMKAKQYNIAIMYDWNGNYISTVKLNKKYELEDVYFNNGILYGQVYHSFTKTVKKKEKVLMTVKKKSKKTGKSEKKKIKKTITVKKVKLYKENYLFTAI